MRRFCIDSSLLGSPRHILGDEEGYAWSESVPRDAWHLTGSPKSAPTSRCLDTLLRLVGRQLPSPPAAHVAAFLSLGIGPEAVPWSQAVPQEAYRIFFKSLVQETTDSFPGLPFDYYEAAWQAGSRVLAALRPVRVDAEAFAAASASPGNNPSVVESFRPKRSGFAHPVVYDRFATRTGRLTVSEGPNILLLKREHRGMLRSAFEGGTVCSLDFRALEPRIVLAEAGRASSAGDLYEEVVMERFGGEASRDAVKTAVIAELYGISRSSLAARLQVSDGVLDSFISAIRSHFGVDALQDRLRAAVVDGGISNRFGRPVAVPPDRGELLVNSYAQSTGVDVAMLGFDAVLRDIASDGVRPLFVLHDALVLDVSPERLPAVSQVSSVRVPTYDVPFPLKFEKF